MSCVHCEARDIPEGLDCSWCLGVDHECDKDCRGLTYPTELVVEVRGGVVVRVFLWDPKAKEPTDTEYTLIDWDNIEVGDDIPGIARELYKKRGG